MKPQAARFGHSWYKLVLLASEFWDPSDPSPVSEAQRYGVSSGQPRRRPTLMDQSKGSGTQDTQGWSSAPILFRASSAYCSCMELDT